MRELRYNHQRGQIPASMSRIPLFSQLKEETLEEVLEHASVVHVESGETFLEEGGPLPDLYILLTGRFSVRKNGQQVAALSNPGELIGEMGFVLGKPPQASVVATASSTVFKIDVQVMNALANEHFDHFQSVIYRYLTKLLAERLVRTSEQLTKVESGKVYYL